ncbi:MAG TPA: hypothetical protein VHM02_06425, partial [Thermoanaerobaculia bacterium]|nr:hypothetical protein [Thermoanaerobaculia bacterium]
VRVYLVALEAGAAGEDGEPAADSFGCGDRLRAVEVPVATEGLDTAGRIAAALGALLGGEATPAGLYDVFARSGLAVETVEELPGVPGVFRVQLTGDLVLGGVCDHPRVRAQLEATARQFPGVEEVELVLAGRPLDAHLTGR